VAVADTPSVDRSTSSGAPPAAARHGWNLAYAVSVEQRHVDLGGSQRADRRRDRPTSKVG
jgi:hypothetical protein